MTTSLQAIRTWVTEALGGMGEDGRTLVTRTNVSLSTYPNESQPFT